MAFDMKAIKLLLFQLSPIIYELKHLNYLEQFIPGGG